MSNYNIKTLEYYIEKHGDTKGRGVYAAELKKKEKYDAQPFKRLTKDWFLWRYGAEEGQIRFESHVAKSTQSLENFIKRYGETEGLKKYEETIAKKNTVALTREKYGDAAEAIIMDRYAKQQETFNKKTPEQKANIIKKRKDSTEKYLDENVRGRPRLELFISKYGAEEGSYRYLETLRKAFQGPNRMSVPAKKIYNILSQKLSPEKLEQIYCDVPDKKEFWLSDSGNLYGYDFTHRESKVILEYNGSFWHPEQANDNLIHPVTKKTLTEMYEYDLRKKKVAEEKGFTVFVVIDTMTLEEQLKVVDNFCKSI